MNRTLFRGVTAGILAAGVASGAVVAVPAIARGAEGDARYTTALSPGEQRIATQFEVPNAAYLRHVHPKKRHARHRASRSTYRAALTGSPQTVAHAMVRNRGWSESQWSCLDVLWTRESSWNPYATNPSTGAYGIPQALPASKMATYGADYRTNPLTQIRWGLDYIAQAYGTPCGALSHSNATGYY